MFVPERLRRLARGFSPEYCPRCALVSVDGFCRHCREDFVRIREPCPACGLPLPCGPCPSGSAYWQLDALRAPFVYTPPLSQFLLRLKFSRERLLGAAFGHLLAAELGHEDLDCEALVIVPLHRRRLITRTFNQADEIARPLAARRGLRLLPTAVARRIDSPAQSALGREARIAGLEGVFVARAGLSGRRIAIVDDVVTTGATVCAVAGALRRAGAARVTAIALARTVSERDDTLHSSPNR